MTEENDKEIVISTIMHIREKVDTLEAGIKDIKTILDKKDFRSPLEDAIYKKVAELIANDLKIVHE
jgi:hypothetical protein